MKAYQYRDLSVIELPDSLIVTACDSSGSIGEKSGDVLSIPTKYVSIFATRVCLFEILSCGAKVVALSNTVSCEMHPTGELIIQGIHEELRRAGIEDIPINGSTEENFKTSMTALGIFVIGTADALRIIPSSSDDIIICIGKPKCGSAVIVEGDHEIANYTDLRILLQSDGVKEIVPCGSKGILWEANNLASIYDLKLNPAYTNLNIDDSTGPATTIIASIHPSVYPELLSLFGNKMSIIGHLN